MKIKAINSIIEWDAENRQMAILNAGDEAEVGDTLAASKIESGDAEEVGGKKKAKAAEPAADQAPA